MYSAVVQLRFSSRVLFKLFNVSFAPLTLQYWNRISSEFVGDY